VLPPLALAFLAHDPLLPSGFIVEELGSSWSAPVALAFADASRLFVAEKEGSIWWVENRVKRNRVLSLWNETLSNGDRGLLGLALDPDFDLNGWMYVLYVADPNEDGIDESVPSFSRLVRYTVVENGAGELVAEPSSRVFLLGATFGSGIPALHSSHAAGKLAFLSDGSLIVSHGDGAHWNVTDPGGLDPLAFGPGKFGPEQDVGSFRAQEPRSLAGKILRLDPATGRGLPDNPFYTGDPNALESRLWARGLRNPYRFTLVPGTGPREALFVCDVGHSTWEELNLARGGENFGWPCHEGAPEMSEYQANDPDGYCDSLGLVSAPWLAWNHNLPGALGFTGRAATGACVYDGSDYPATWRGGLFFCDFGAGWLRVAHFDAALQRTWVRPFASELGSPIDLVRHPGNGDLVYITLEVGEHRILRLRYAPANRSPVARLEATPRFGATPLTVALSAATSSDPDGDALTYHWDLGDGTSSSAPALQKVYGGTQPFTATLTVTDTLGSSDTESITIYPGNTPPTINALNSPVENDYYVDGLPVFLNCVVSDVQDDAQNLPLAVRWEFDLHHDHHVHASWATVHGRVGQWSPEPHDGGALSLTVRLIVTDSAGLETRREFSLYDAGGRAEPHIVEVSQARAGFPVAARIHSDFPAPPDGERATLTVDWGDGTSDVYPEAEHWRDLGARHTYAAAGDYTLRVTADALGFSEEAERAITVARPRDSLAVFRPLFVERYIGAGEQAFIADELAARFDSSREVALFDASKGAELAAWMDERSGDGFVDALVLLDLVPALVFAGESEGSRLERWVEQGNILLWSGAAACTEAIAADLTTTALGANALDLVLDSGPELASGSGTENLQPLASRLLPSLTATDALHALRLDRLGPQWSARRTFTLGPAPASDALELVHASGGVYAQFYGIPGTGLPRLEVLREYLELVWTPKAKRR
jgi:glucose/arabinose dehydrogenase/PKD repeat protein